MGLQVSGLRIIRQKQCWVQALVIPRCPGNMDGLQVTEPQKLVFCLPPSSQSLTLPPGSPWCQNSGLDCEPGFCGETLEIKGLKNLELSRRQSKNLLLLHFCPKQVLSDRCFPCSPLAQGSLDMPSRHTGPALWCYSGLHCLDFSR